MGLFIGGIGLLSGFDGNIEVRLILLLMVWQGVTNMGIIKDACLFNPISFSWITTQIE